MLAAFLRLLFSRDPKTVAEVMGPLTKIHAALHAIHVAAEADIAAAQATLDAAKAVSEEAKAAKAAVASVIPAKTEKPVG